MRRPTMMMSPVVVVTIVAVVAAAGVVGSAPRGFAAAAARVQATPAIGTPQLVQTGTTEQVRQLVQCGSTMYAVGTFTQIRSGTTTYTRNGAFSFSATAPYRMTSWNPDVTGTVNSIAFNGTDCATAYLGGKFTAIGATAVSDIAAVDTSAGAVDPTFADSANGEVDTILGWQPDGSAGHLLVGGAFTSINGDPTDPYFASLDPVTGANDGYLSLGISGDYDFTNETGTHSVPNRSRIYNQQLSHDGTRDLVEGDFTTIGGQPRRQIAMLDLGATAATTDAWYPDEFDQNCSFNVPFYARAASWSPTDDTVYVAATGGRPALNPGFAYSDRRAGLCDSASAFPATSAEVTHLWINYTGCDSLYASAADASTAYFAGHERWASNPNGCNAKGSGAVRAQGMVGLSPTTGSIRFNPTRARGLGADDMLLTAAGLWIASDNYHNADQCSGIAGHAGICLLPYHEPVVHVVRRHEHPHLTVSSPHRGRLRVHVVTRPELSRGLVRILVRRHHRLHRLRTLTTNRHGSAHATFKVKPGRTYRLRAKIPRTSRTMTGISPLRRVKIRK